MSRGWVVAGAAAALFTLACAVALVYLVMRFRVFNTPSEAMAPTLGPGETFLVDRFAYRGGVPRRGDIIVFVPPIASKNPFIKRVLALPGERFAVRGGKAWVNGKPLAEPYLAEPGHYTMAVQHFTIVTNGEPLDRASAEIPPREDWTAPDGVPRGCYVVLGDNRDNSEDSHVFGFLCPGRRAPGGATQELIGRALHA